jgi:hypothetical protein
VGGLLAAPAKTSKALLSARTWTLSSSVAMTINILIAFIDSPHMIFPAIASGFRANYEADRNNFET